jgi:hypothetical protein
MTYSFIRDVPIDEAQYAEVRSIIGQETPKGLVAHLVVRRTEGLRYIDVWDSEEDWQHFRDERVAPAVRAMLAAHGTTPPNLPLPQERLDVIDTWVPQAQPTPS